jgi:hypothetical protein
MVIPLVVIHVIILMVIGGLSHCKPLMVILLMAIDGYFIGDY